MDAYNILNGLMNTHRKKQQKEDNDKISIR